MEQPAIRSYTLTFLAETSSQTHESRTTVKTEPWLGYASVEM